MIYFDNASTTKISKPVLEAVVDMLENGYANPSSLHSLGFEVEKKITRAREIIANALRVTPDEIYFTSGGTEANNTAILGACKAGKRRGSHFVTVNIEHPSVMDCYKELEAMGKEVTYLEVDEKGYVNIDELESLIREDTVLVSVMYVNNEVGTIQDIAEIAKRIKAKNANTLFHVDCVQAFGKHIIDTKNIDLISMSGHKIHAPKGVGALYIKKGVRLESLHFGGGQESAFRPGTENTSAIVGMGVACELAYNNLTTNLEKVALVRKKVLEITQRLEGVHVNGDIENGSPYILNLSFEGVKGEVLLHSLESEDIFVATGSACSSRVKKKKKVVDFIIDGRGENAIRLSFSDENTVEEAEKLLEVLERLVPMLRRFQPR